MKGCFYWLHSVPLGTKGGPTSAWHGAGTTRVDGDPGPSGPRAKKMMRYGELTWPLSITPGKKWHLMRGTVGVSIIKIAKDASAYFKIYFVDLLFCNHHISTTMDMQPCFGNRMSVGETKQRLSSASVVYSAVRPAGILTQVGQASSWMLRFPPNHCSSLKIPNSYLCFMTFRSGSPIVFASGNPELILVTPPFLRGNPWFFTHKSHLLPRPTGDLQQSPPAGPWTTSWHRTPRQRWSLINRLSLMCTCRTVHI